MTSFIPNTLSATLKESNYRNQIYSSENGNKFPDFQSFDDNDERSDPKYGDLFYEDYKKKNDEKNKSEENSTGENSIKCTPIPKETKNEILGNKRNRSKSKKNENLSKEKGDNENFEIKSNNDSFLIELLESEDNPIGADETSKETPHQTICDISQKEKEDMKKKGRKTPGEKIEKLTGIFENKKAKTNKGKNNESENDSENADSSKKDSIDKQKLPESFEKNPLNSKSQKQISQDSEANKNNYIIKQNLYVKINNRKDDLSAIFENWISKIGNCPDIKNNLKNDEITIIKNNIKEYLDNFENNKDSTNKDSVNHQSVEEKKEKDKVTEFINKFLEFLKGDITKKILRNKHEKCRNILKILCEKNDRELLTKLIKFIKLEGNDYIRINNAEKFQDIGDLSLTEEEKKDIMMRVGKLIKIVIGHHQKKEDASKASN
jgi:hypothetical protein